MINLTKFVFPEETGNTQLLFVKHLGNAFDAFLKELKKNELEDLYLAQKDKEIKTFLEVKLLEFYAKELAGVDKDDSKFSTLRQIIFRIHLTALTNIDPVRLLRHEAVQTYLNSQTVEKVILMYDVLMEDNDDYSSFIVSEFTEILLNKINKEVPFYLIEKACKAHTEFCHEKIGSQIEKKLNFSFS